MKKPFIVFGFLLTLFASAIFGDYAIPRGEFAPRLAGSGAESLQQTFSDFIAGVTGGWATNSAQADQAPRSEVGAVASADRLAGATASRATSAAASASGAATGSDVSTAVRSAQAPVVGGMAGGSFGGGAALGNGGGGAAGGGGSSSGGESKGRAAANNADSSSTSESGDAVMGGVGGGSGRRTNSDRGTSTDEQQRSNTPRGSGDPAAGNAPDDLSGLPPAITDPLGNLFDEGGLGPVGQNPVTDYLGASPSPTGSNPSWLTQPEGEKTAAAPAVAPAVVAQDVPELSSTWWLLALALAGLTLLRRPGRRVAA